MKGNNEKRKWYFLIAVALIVGAMVGYFATNSLATKGNATNSIGIGNEEGGIIKAPGTYHPPLKKCCCNWLCTSKSAYCCDNSNNTR